MIRAISQASCDAPNCTTTVDSWSAKAVAARAEEAGGRTVVRYSGRNRAVAFHYCPLHSIEVPE